MEEVGRVICSLSSGMIDQDGFRDKHRSRCSLKPDDSIDIDSRATGITSQKVSPRVQKRVSIEGFREMSILMDNPNSFGKEVKRSGSWRAVACRGAV